MQGNNSPSVSIEPRLEFLKPTEIKVNTTMQDHQLIIMDTGASLAMTGNKQDFLPASFREVSLLKLGGIFSS